MTEVLHSDISHTQGTLPNSYVLKFWCNDEIDKQSTSTNRGLHNEFIIIHIWSLQVLCFVFVFCAVGG